MLLSWSPPCSSEEDKGWECSISMAPWLSLTFQHIFGRAKSWFWGARRTQGGQRGKGPIFPTCLLQVTQEQASSISMTGPAGNWQKGILSPTCGATSPDPYLKAVILGVPVELGALELQMMLVITLQSRGVYL